MKMPQVKSYKHVIGTFYGSVWAITDEKFAEIDAAFQHRLLHGSGLAATEVALEDADGYDSPRAGRPGRKDLREVQGDIGIVQLRGTISPRPSVFSSGGTSCSEFCDTLSAMVKDEDIAAIVLDCDSPGGMVSGVPEAAQKVREFAAIKPIHTSINYNCQSAAYWIAAQTTSISISPSASCGNIGVMMKIPNVTKANEMSGVSYRILKSSKNKGTMDPDMPVDEEAMARAQRNIDQTYSMFLDAVAAGRRVARSRVASEEWGEGASFQAEDALKIGMVDRIATMEQVLDMLRGSSKRKRGMESMKRSKGD